MLDDWLYRTFNYRTKKTLNTWLNEAEETSTYWENWFHAKLEQYTRLETAYYALLKTNTDLSDQLDISHTPYGQELNALAPGTDYEKGFARGLRIYRQRLMSSVSQWENDDPKGFFVGASPAPDAFLQPMDTLPTHLMDIPHAETTPPIIMDLPITATSPGYPTGSPHAPGVRQNFDVGLAEATDVEDS